MHPRINLITLGVKDLKKSTEFYETGLGWKRSEESNDSVSFFQLGGIILSLFGEEDLASDMNLPFSPKPNYTGITLAQNVPTEAEVDSIIEKMRGLGAKIIKEPQKVFWGGYSAYFQDLDGHCFEIAHNPFFPLNERGEIQLSK
ncbi:VOC family protein [Leptospira sp. 96542]|nr:VOC family protein [Leptospira sp. 96542]